MSFRANQANPGRATFRRAGRDWLQLPFFVYGTLRRGQSNYWLLRNNTVEELPATLEGANLYALPSYPVLVESELRPEAEAVVYGELMVLHPAQYASVLPELDQLESYDPFAPPEVQAESLYQRVKRLVRLKGGSQAWAWVYTGNWSALRTHSPEFISSGDWVAFRRERLRRMLDGER